MIVFLSINSKVNPLYVFILINATDVGCLIAGGPVAAFFQQSNAQILKEHRETVDKDPFNEALGVFAKWVKVHHQRLFSLLPASLLSGSLSIEATLDQMLFRSFGQDDIHHPCTSHPLGSLRKRLSIYPGRRSQGLHGRYLLYHQ